VLAGERARVPSGSRVRRVRRVLLRRGGCLAWPIRGRIGGGERGPVERRRPAVVGRRIADRIGARNPTGQAVERRRQGTPGENGRKKDADPTRAAGTTRHSDGNGTTQRALRPAPAPAHGRLSRV